MIQSATNSASPSWTLSSFIARWRQGREDRRRQKQQDEEERRKVQHLMPQVYEKTLKLPFTGDYVVVHLINGVEVRSNDLKHEVVVSTAAKEYIVPCSSKDEAETIRHNIALAGGLLSTSGGY